MVGIATQPLTNQLFGLTMIVSSPANTLLGINHESGMVTVIGATGLPSIIEADLAFNPIDGMLYGIQDTGPGFTQNNLFTINATTGAATIVGNTFVNGDLSSLAFDAFGTLYAIDSGTSGNSSLLTIDPITALVTSSIPLNTDLGSAVGMVFHPLTGEAYIADGGDDSPLGNFYTLNTISGDLTLIGSTNVTGGLSGLAFVTVVPEPSTLSYSIILMCWYGRYLVSQIKGRNNS